MFNLVPVPNPARMPRALHSLSRKTSITMTILYRMLLCLLFISRIGAQFAFLEVNRRSRPPSVLSYFCLCVYQLTYHNRAQVIVCLNVNFAQQRCHSHHPDPIDPHLDTHFLSEQAVNMMKQLVDHAWPLESHTNSGWQQLPDETLDDCERTFVAAQSHIAKASHAIFADTALMALLCRHDRPLFLVNMTSAGERQYYALALIKALFLHLPSDWVVALLYDIACQLERSMRKVGLPLNVITSAELVLARLFARVYRSDTLFGFSIPCFRSPMGMSAPVPPTEVQRIWTIRRRGLRAPLECSEKDDTLPSLCWGMSLPYLAS